MAADDMLQGRAARPNSVLYLCGMNVIRSPMAEFLTRALFGRDIYVASAGVRAGSPDPFVIAAMAERGIDISGRTPVMLDDLEDTYFDIVVTLSPEAHHRALELTRSQAIDVEYWPTMDPSTVAGNRDQVMQSYRQVRDALEKRILERFGRSAGEATA